MEYLQLQCVSAQVNSIIMWGAGAVLRPPSAGAFKFTSSSKTPAVFWIQVKKTHFTLSFFQLPCLLLSVPVTGIVNKHSSYLMQYFPWSFHVPLGRSQKWLWWIIFVSSFRVSTSYYFIVYWPTQKQNYQSKNCLKSSAYHFRRMVLDVKPLVQSFGKAVAI